MGIEHVIVIVWPNKKAPSCSDHMHNPIIKLYLTNNYIEHNKRCCISLSYMPGIGITCKNCILSKLLFF